MIASLVETTTVVFRPVAILTGRYGIKGMLHVAVSELRYHRMRLGVVSSVFLFWGSVYQ